MKKWNIDSNRSMAEWRKTRAKLDSDMWVMANELIGFQALEELESSLFNTGIDSWFWPTRTHLDDGIEVVNQ